MKLRTPLIMFTIPLATLTLTACGDDDDNGVNDTVNVNTEVSVLTNDPNVVASTVPTVGASIPAESQAPATVPTTATPSP